MKSEEHQPAARILRTADRLFYEQGYATTGVNQIVAESEVAKDSFYRHFPKKEDLVVAYLKNRHAAFSEGVARVVAARRSPATKIMGIFDYVGEWLRDTDFRGCAFQNAIAEFPDADSLPRQVVSEVKSEQRAYIAELCAQAGHRDIGEQVFLLLEGAVSQAAIEGSGGPVSEARRAVKRWLAA